MELKLYYAILRRWLWLILLCTLLAAAGAYLFSSQQARVYQARSTVLLDNSKAASDGQAYSDILAGERLARTYAEMFNGRQALNIGLDQLGYKPDILDVSVSPQRDTTLLSVIVESSNPEAAAFLANTLPDVVAEQQRTRQAARYATTKASLTEELNSLASDIGAEREAIARLSATAGEDDAEVSRRNAGLGLQQTTYETLLQNLAAIRLAEAQELDVLSLVEPAAVPTVPIRPRVPLNTLLAALVGAMIGLGTGFLIEYLDDTVKASSDFAHLFGMGPLAFIGRIEEEGERVLVSALDNRAPMAEAYRMLRTNIRFAAVDGPLKTLLVTSPGPGEGKSTTSANLAVVLAQAGHHTILVDADLRRPTQHRIFNVSNQKGLTTALVERSTTGKRVLASLGD